MTKKIEINFETNELNYYLGGYFDAGGSVCIEKKNIKKRNLHAYGLKISCCFDNLKIN